MRKFLTIVAMLGMLMPMTVGGQTTSVNVTWTWTAPTTGSAVHHYVIQTSSNGTTWTSLTTPQPTNTTVTLSCPVGVNIQIRVAGVDAQSRQGAYSQSSDPFVPDAGVPGAPSQPIRAAP